MTDRTSLLLLIRAAQAAARHDFARSTAADWLAAWPGDLEVQALLAQAEIALGHRDLATERLSNIVVSDPEYTEAYDLLADCLRDRGEAALGRIFAACARALRGGEPDRKAAPPWAGPLGRAIRAIAGGESTVAVAESQAALTANADLPLPALIAAKAHLAAGDRSGAYAIAKAASERWPECVPILLLQASELLEGGQGAQAVEFLQRAAAADPTSRIADRLLGTDHPFRSLWPTAITASLSRPVPADVAAVLGDNRLGGAGSAPVSSDPVPAPPATEPSGTVAQAHAAEPGSAAIEATPSDPSSSTSGELEPPPGASLGEDGLPAPLPWESFRGPDAGDDGAPDIPDEVETLVDIRRDLDRMAAKIGSSHGPKDEDGRVPAYIVLSSRTRLSQQFGEDRFRRVDEAVMTLVEAVRRRRGWTAYRVYIDDPNVLLPFGLSPADPGNAWQIKLRLADLDHALAARGEMIGAVLILGGGAIVPFHLLPNPTDDDDQAVPSDNPYSTTDENYFIPEWPVGRFPVDKDADFLVRLLRATIFEHLSALQPPNLITRLHEWLATVQTGLIGLPQRSIGYSASIWRRSSLAVYRTIGEPRWMVTSPPAEAGSLPAQVFKPARLSYFNLHGLEDSPEWFGQRDPARDPAGATEFPVALRPQDIVNGGRAPRVVFTEACYGANALGKDAESSMSLKFLDSGSRAVVGSTKGFLWVGHAASDRRGPAGPPVLGTAELRRCRGRSTASRQARPGGGNGPPADLPGWRGSEDVDLVRPVRRPALRGGPNCRPSGAEDRHPAHDAAQAGQDGLRARRPRTVHGRPGRSHLREGPGHRHPVPARHEGRQCPFPRAALRLRRRRSCLPHASTGQQAGRREQRSNDGDHVVQDGARRRASTRPFCPPDPGFKWEGPQAGDLPVAQPWHRSCIIDATGRTRLVSPAAGRIGYHYYPDERHYTQKDLETWLPILASLGARWVTLRGSTVRSIPESFLRALIDADISPIVPHPCSLDEHADGRADRDVWRLRALGRRSRCGV